MVLFGFFNIICDSFFLLGCASDDKFIAKKRVQPCPKLGAILTPRAGRLNSGRKEVLKYQLEHESFQWCANEPLAPSSGA